MASLPPSPASSSRSSPPTSCDDTDRVEWRAAPGRELAELAKHGLAGLSLALFSLVAVGMLFFAFGTSVDGYAGVFLMLLIVGGPFSLLYFVTAIGAGGTESLVKLIPGAETLSLPGVTVAMLGGGVAILSVFVHPLLPVTYAATLVGLYVVDRAQRTAGVVDAGTATFTRHVGETELRHDVSSFAGLRSFRVGDYVLCWLQFNGLALGTPRLVVFPAAKFPAIRATFDEIRTAERDEDSSAPGVGVYSAIFGLLFVGLAAAIVVVVANPLLSFYATTIFGLLGAFFLFLAWKS
ncbi:hypothetical protein [Haloprofundus salilacus]|uniref:hypothetical protein n=1 Tax=Haloprofundus salilacus TaxID=2876190 RepID=UPI001CCA4F70|nr:hypothetical protein [Haloprofundus salilacus]